MKPKEKAKELLEKYDETLTYLESKSKAKQCALISVDEIINYLEVDGFSTQIKYWLEVKQEIELI